MNRSLTKSERHRQRKSERHRHLRKAEAATSTTYIPYDHMKEVFSFLPVKSLLRLRCVSKSCNSFISDPTFIKMHFNRSSQKNVTLVYRNINIDFDYTYVTLTKSKLYSQMKDWDVYGHVIGSCNGLLCLFYDNNTRSWFRVWNPATRAISDELGSNCYYCSDLDFAFGYDSSKDTYKLVFFLPLTTKVRVLNLKDKVWRDIQDSPVAHRHLPGAALKFVHFSDSVNWLVVCNYNGVYNHDYKNISIEQFVIISLDLCSETHTKLLPPQGFNEVPFVMPNLSVLNHSLCFSHDFKKTHFIIWQMTEFGVENSWTQFLKISYHNLQTNRHPKFVLFPLCISERKDPKFDLFPLCLSEKNDIILLTNEHESRAILYNWRNNTARRIDNSRELKYGKVYVESFFSYC